MAEKLKIESDDLKVEEWENIPLDQRLGLQRVLTELRHSDIAMWVATFSLAVIGAAAVSVLVAAFALSLPTPDWATAAVSAIIAAAIALVFNSRGSR